MYAYACPCEYNFFPASTHDDILKKREHGSFSLYKTRAWKNAKNYKSSTLEGQEFLRKECLFMISMMGIESCNWDGRGCECQKCQIFLKFFWPFLEFIFFFAHFAHNPRLHLEWISQIFHMHICPCLVCLAFHVLPWISQMIRSLRDDSYVKWLKACGIIPARVRVCMCLCLRLCAQRMHRTEICQKLNESLGHLRFVTTVP